MPVEFIAKANGRIREILGTDPPPGAEWSETVPTGSQWRLIAVSAVFTCDATVATRQLFMGMRGPVGPDVFISNSGIQIQSQSFTRRWAIVGTPLPPTGFIILGPLPIGHIMGPGFVFHSDTGNFQAGDDWGPPTFWIEEWDL